MEKPKPLCWADFSEDETSDTEDLTPLVDPNKKALLDSINSSSQNLFHFKIENLPYSISSNEQIQDFLGLSENEATIRMQYKGKKFNGFALAVAKSKDVASYIAMKYGSNFNGRPILIYYKPNEHSQWIPQKKIIASSSQCGFEKMPEQCKIENFNRNPTYVERKRGNKNRYFNRALEDKVGVLRDTAIVSALLKKNGMSESCLRDSTK